MYTLSFVSSTNSIVGVTIGVTIRVVAMAKNRVRESRRVSKEDLETLQSEVSYLQYSIHFTRNGNFTR